MYMIPCDYCGKKFEEQELMVRMDTPDSEPLVFACENCVRDQIILEGK